MLNPNKVLRDYLLTVDALTALVGTNIAYPDLPAKTDVAGGAKALVFSARGGLSGVETPLLKPSYQFRAWALRPAEAREVYAALFDALHGKSNLGAGAARILAAFEEVSAQDVTDEESGWATVLGFFRIVLPQDPTV